MGVQQGFRKESARVPQRFRKGSARVPQGFRKGSAKVPHACGLKVVGLGARFGGFGSWAGPEGPRTAQWVRKGNVVELVGVMKSNFTCTCITTRAEHTKSKEPQDFRFFVLRAFYFGIRGRTYGSTPELSNTRKVIHTCMQAATHTIIDIIWACIGQHRFACTSAC